MGMVNINRGPLWIPNTTGATPDMGLAKGGPTNTTINGTNGAVHMTGQMIMSDGASHTIDTTGSSKIWLRLATATFANGASTVRVGISTTDLANGPPARATVASNLVTFDVHAALTGPTGITANAWNSWTPTSGSKAIADGDIVTLAIQFTNRAGADSIQVSNQAGTTTCQFPCVTSEAAAGTFAAVQSIPCCIIQFADGAYGWFFGSTVNPSSTNTTFGDNTVNKIESGNYYKFPFPVTVCGASFGGNGVTGDCTIKLYRTPLGTPAQATTVTILTKVRASSGGGREEWFFTTPVTFKANEEFALAIASVGTNGANFEYATVGHADHWQVQSLPGANCYAVTRDIEGGATPAFAQQNSGKDRFHITPIISSAFTGVNDLIGGFGGLIG